MHPDTTPSYFKCPRELFELAEGLPWPQGAKVIYWWEHLFFYGAEPEGQRLPKAAEQIYHAKRGDVLRIRRSAINGAKNRQKTEEKPTKNHPKTGMENDGETDTGFLDHTGRPPADISKAGTHPDTDPEADRTPDRPPIGNTKYQIPKTKDKEKPLRGKEKAERFVPPTPKEVDAYISEIGAEGCFTGREFVDFYESTGWKVGRNTHMGDWRAKAREWKESRASRQQGGPQSGSADESGHDLEEGNEW